ncbi:hypothetical protein VT06_13820 [Arsukibacterium sp. MJ3]|uniref:hypothetical protein n=1 Tax=Arsukibacterium sp. MJ3 TaxID=1632859 RepID=UPI0006273AD5|nr:hypothetical protein [Arsukibacterium sp. MJ3]KKO48067.1 hypothetical protein VT06_13820 [Arsukibacterium sp. MJ3]
MLKPLLFNFGMLALLSGQALADTVLTEQNLSRLESALPQLAKIQQDDVGSLQHVRLQRHCDWPRHAREVRAQQQGKDYLVEVDKILASHQLNAAMFMELSAKGSWPVLESLQPVLSITRQTLPFLPQVQRQQAEQFLAQTDNMTTVIGPCLSDADKVALGQQRQRLINLATRLPGSILPAQAANLTP